MRKNKNHMILSADVEKAFDKLQHPFLIKTLQSVGIEGTFPNIIKNIYEMPPVNIIFIKKKTEIFSPKVRNMNGMPTLITAIQHSTRTRSPSLSNPATKRNKRHSNWQKGSQTLPLRR